MPYKIFISSPIHLLPNGFTLVYFQQIFSDMNLARGFLNSVLRTIAGTGLTVTCTMMAAYALSIYKLKLSRFLSAFFLIPMFFGAGLVPFYLTMNAYHLTNTFWVLVLPGLCSPMWLFVAKANMASYSREILEAARIDGAGQFRIFWQIVWPTNTPIIAIVGLMTGLGHWNEYFTTRILVRKNLWTAPVHLFSILQEQTLYAALGKGTVLNPLCFQAAVAACLILPIIVVYPFLQRFVVSGLTAGSVKG
jgi:putative aldouronate transport system permease protein